MSRKVKPIVVIGFLFPGMLLYIYFFFVPMVKSFYISLTDWNGFSNDKTFIGLKNFVDLSKDKNFIAAFQNTLYFLVLGGIIVFFLTFFFTYLMTRKGFHGRKFYSNFFYFPNMVSQAALAVMWIFVFNPNFGLLNNILNALGLSKLIKVWLGSRMTGMTSIIFATSVSFVGFYLILFLSGYDRIPDTYLEAARIDGATDIQIYFKVVIPLLRDVIVISVTLWIINIIKYFELIWAMFKGYNVTFNTLGTYMYSVAFGVANPIFKLGYGSAVAVFMFVFVAVLAGSLRKIFDSETMQY